jgi:hypothetical protein
VGSHSVRFAVAKLAEFQKAKNPEGALAAESAFFCLKPARGVGARASLNCEHRGRHDSNFADVFLLSVGGVGGSDCGSDADWEKRGESKRPRVAADFVDGEESPKRVLENVEDFFVALERRN